MHHWKTTIQTNRRHHTAQSCRSFSSPADCSVRHPLSIVISPPQQTYIQYLCLITAAYSLQFSVTLCDSVILTLNPSLTFVFDEKDLTALFDLGRSDDFGPSMIISILAMHSVSNKLHR